MLKERVSNINRKGNGKLIIKEYPTGQANTSHFRALLNELKLKKNFIPDMIFVDYLNICSSSRMKGMGGAINSYSYIKAIAEEMRGLAVEFNVPIVSATQTTRAGYTSSDPGLEDTSESFGLPATADLMFALVSNEELEQQGQIMVKQLKNRYNDPNMNKRFVIGVDRSKMRLSDVNTSEQTLINDTPTFDRGNVNERFKDFKIE
jgi:replicative DNA helicase